MASKTINVYIGTTDEQKGRRIAALEKLAKAAGHLSISGWLIALADEESKMYTIKQENLDNVYQTKWTLGGVRGNGSVATGFIQMPVNEADDYITASLYRDQHGIVSHYPHDANLVNKDGDFIDYVDHTQIKIEQ